MNPPAAAPIPDANIQRQYIVPGLSFPSAVSAFPPSDVTYRPNVAAQAQANPNRAEEEVTPPEEDEPAVGARDESMGKNKCSIKGCPNLPSGHQLLSCSATGCDKLVHYQCYKRITEKSTTLDHVYEDHQFCTVGHQQSFGKDKSTTMG